MVEQATAMNAIEIDSGREQPLLLTAREAAALFHTSVRVWRGWDAMGHVPQPVRIGRKVFWRPDELKAWVAAGCPERETWEVLRN